MEFFTDNINLVVILPLIMCLIIGFNRLISNRIDKPTIFLISIISAFICMVFSAAVFDFSVIKNMSLTQSFQWMTLENISLYLGTYIDKVAVSFVLITNIAAFFIQNFAFFKLREHNDFSRLMLYINFFATGLNGIFISSNLFQTYLFCEVAGVASYLLINFDFANRAESKAAIKSYIFNRVGDLILLLCVLVTMYFSVVYNELSGLSALSFANMGNIAASIHSLMSEPVFVFFCSVLLFVIIMKFMQAFIYITFESSNKTDTSRIILYQNSLFALVGIFLFMRLNPFFFELSRNFWWTLPVLILIFVFFGLVNRLFMPFCSVAGWIEKYVVETVINFIALFFRALSYVSGRFQGGNFQSYLIYSLAGLILILVFVLIFYVVLINV